MGPEFSAFFRKEIREAEKLGLKFAEKESDILRKNIARLNKIYQKTTVSQFFSWDDVSLVIVGAFLADFCVIDRIPFKPENHTEDMLPPIQLSDSYRWGYKGFEKLLPRYPSLKWKFYQNINQEKKMAEQPDLYIISPRKKEKTAPPLQNIDPNHGLLS